MDSKDYLEDTTPALLGFEGGEARLLERLPGYAVTPPRAPVGSVDIYAASTPYEWRHGAQWRGARTNDVDASVKRNDPEMAAGNTKNTGGGRTDPVGQWRPEEQQIVNNTMLSALQAMTQHLLRMEESKPPTPDFTYSGAEVENPEEYITKLLRWFGERRIREENWVNLARKTLRGEAKKWADNVTAYDIPWHLFHVQFMARFNSQITLGQLSRKLYGESQKPKEDALAFVTTKFQLFRRIAPETPEAQQIVVIQELLSPWIRTAVRQERCHSIQQLMEAVVHISTDVVEQATTPHPGGLAFQKEERNATAVVTPTTHATTNTPLPPNPCRHYGGPHYNNRCPIRFQRGQTADNSTNPGAGNAIAAETRGAGRNETAPAPAPRMVQP